LPLYEYRCTDCGYHFEKIQHFRSKAEVDCPKCHGKLKRPLTAPAFRFKGSGWYVTDYAGKNEAASSGSHDSSAATPAPAAKAKPAAAKSTATPEASTASA
jgi:putative FmdB family regulatory protein